MNPHDELELLSSYLDEELDASERARLDTHMTSCVECRETLVALQATIADLKALPEVAPTPQDSWALRAAIRRARSPMRKWQRISYAAGAVAAAAIAFVVMTLPGDNGGRGTALQAESASAVPVFQSGQNLQPVDAQARLLSLAGVTTQRDAISAPVPAAGGVTEGTTTDTAGKVVAPQPESYSAYAATPDDRAAIERCVMVARESTQEFLEPLRYEIATFESKPAYLLYFRSGERYELWVVQRSDCEVLYFSQAGG
ncbi:MAG: anti-sigma factor family protein [Actinomycetota bacterium]